MKTVFKISVTILFWSFMGVSCNLDEENPNLNNENIFVTADSSVKALNGVYAAMLNWNYMGNQYIFMNNLGSGFGFSRRGGNSYDSFDNSTLCSLKPSNSSTYVENTWKGMYITISRCNDIIASADTYASPSIDDERVMNEVVGQAYFIRAFTYFNLVRMWGAIPLRTEPTQESDVYLPYSSEKLVYQQIDSDSQKALELMSDALGTGYPKPTAVNMLRAKMYMTLATAPAMIQETGVDYWQEAYNEAIKAYGAYELVSDYASLFDEGSSDNTSESIFEIQSAIGASLDFVRSFTASNFCKANTFGFIRINAEVYDRHFEAYPNDERIDATYLYSYVQQHNNRQYNAYPIAAGRTGAWGAFPYLKKLGTKNPQNTITQGNQNYIIYRYADLLLMLAEISNELQNGEQLSYVSEVLSRVNLSPHDGYTGDQDAFRTAIMKEYQFELLMEGHDWFNNRRRGYDYFLNHVILPHNNYSKFKANVDVTHETDSELVMHIPIPASEINYNQEISE